MAHNEALIRLPDGAGLWTRDSGGDGPAVVFAHPHSGNHCSWEAQWPAFVAAGYRAVAYSRRGYYRSDPVPEGACPSQSADLAALLDALGIERSHVVGSAAGGSTALDFALAFPARTVSAVIASSLMSIDEPDYKAASARARGPWFESLPIEARELSASFRAMDPEGAAAWRAIYDLNGFGANGRPRAQRLQSSIDWKTLGANSRPLLLMTGAADLYLPPALLRAVAPRIGAAQAVVAADVGHPIFAEAPALFNASVLAFLASHA